MRRCYAIYFVLLAVIPCGCASIDYDAQADRQIVALTRNINQNLIGWRIEVEDSGGKLPYDAAFYSKVEAQLSELKIRMTALGGHSGQRIGPVFDSLETQIGSMRQLHRQQNTLDASFLNAELQLLNEQLSLLDTYELALKRGTPAQ
jgi:hypothetical protein